MMFRSDPERTCKWIACQTLYSFLLYLLNATDYIFLLVVKNLFLTYHPSLRRMSLEVIYIYIGR